MAAKVKYSFRITNTLRHPPIWHLLSQKDIRSQELFHLGGLGLHKCRKEENMAKDSDGRKYNRIPEHTKVVNGKKVTVREHVRSNRNDSKGTSKKG